MAPLTDRVLALFREIPGVSDFLHSGATPLPSSSAEADFDRGDRVPVLSRTFTQMEGGVAAALADTGK
jgi:hypothetical protein